MFYPYLLFGSLQDLVDLLELKMPLIYNGLGVLQFNWGIPQSMSVLGLITQTISSKLRFLFSHGYQVVAGLAADGRQIVGRTKSEANNYESLHDSPFDTTNLKNVCKKAELSQPNNKLTKLRLVEFVRSIISDYR
ncbi:golgin candidate 5 [Prunus dulcis]|uniref:Golgin candidate 5 n=1 Tax=Prunus dulcis TaxID=3755 RepID=A0A4Y1RU59_PRUDU|nr:golgin candidate 5 [Prunus dulcis]